MLEEILTNHNHDKIHEGKKYRRCHEEEQLIQSKVERSEEETKTSPTCVTNFPTHRYQHRWKSLQSQDRKEGKQER